MTRLDDQEETEGMTSRFLGYSYEMKHLQKGETGGAYAHYKHLREDYLQYKWDGPSR